MISTSVKQNDDFMIMIEKLNTSRPSLKMTTRAAIADHVKTTGHNIKWDHFDILASGKTDYHCKIKEMLGSLKRIIFIRTFLLVPIKGLCLKVFLVYSLLVV